jgi:hypothetical protein
LGIRILGIRIPHYKISKRSPYKVINSKAVIFEISRRYGGVTVLPPAVWRIRDVYPGSRILIFTHPGSRIPDPKTAMKEF